MKTIGLIGGMSWESTASYYEQINQEIKKRLGGLHSGKILLHSVDFDEIEKMQQAGEWEEAGNELARIAKNLKNAGVEGIALCTNTMHKVANHITDTIKIPFLHIGDATAKDIKKEEIDNILLLGTRFTMQENFYKEVLQNRDIQVMIPNKDECQIIDKIIFEELCLGIINKSSKNEYIKIINHAKEINPKLQGVILGCTEIGLLINQTDTNLKLFDTTTLHVKNIVDFMLS